MRAFIVVSNTGVTAPIFDIRSLASTSGRLDLICRSLIASLLTPKGLRKDTTFFAILKGPPNPPLTIIARGSKIDTLPIDEVSIAKIIKRVMSREHIRGFEVKRKDLKYVLNILSKSKYKLIYLREDGENIENIEFYEDTNYAFILGDQKGLSRADEKLLDKYGANIVSLGRVPYMTSFCISVINYVLDMRIY